MKKVIFAKKTAKGYFGCILETSNTDHLVGFIRDKSWHPEIIDSIIHFGDRQLLTAIALGQIPDKMGNPPRIFEKLDHFAIVYDDGFYYGEGELKPVSSYMTRNELIQSRFNDLIGKVFHDYKSFIGDFQFLNNLELANTSFISMGESIALKDLKFPLVICYINSSYFPQACHEIHIVQKEAFNA